MGFELEEDLESKRLKEIIDQFSPAQLKSLYQYTKILKKEFSDKGIPTGKLIRSLLNMSTERTGEQTTTSTLPIRWEMLNEHKVVHGGVIATFIDHALGRTLITCYPYELVHTMTVNLNIHYLKGGQGQQLIAETNLIKAGKRLAVLDCLVSNDDGDVVAKATGTFKYNIKGEKVKSQ